MFGRIISKKKLRTRVYENNSIDLNREEFEGEVPIRCKIELYETHVGGFLIISLGGMLED